MKDTTIEQPDKNDEQIAILFIYLDKYSNMDETKRYLKNLNSITPIDLNMHLDGCNISLQRHFLRMSEGLLLT